MSRNITGHLSGKNLDVMNCRLRLHHLDGDKLQIPTKASAAKIISMADALYGYHKAELGGKKRDVMQALISYGAICSAMRGQEVANAVASNHESSPFHTPTKKAKVSSSSWGGGASSSSCVGVE